jgi:hypothetical protein
MDDGRQTDEIRFLKAGYLISWLETIWIVHFYQPSVVSVGFQFSDFLEPE